MSFRLHDTTGTFSGVVSCTVRMRIPLPSYAEAVKYEVIALNLGSRLLPPQLIWSCELLILHFFFLSIDVHVDHPDKKSIWMYVASLYQVLPQLPAIIQPQPTRNATNGTAKPPVEHATSRVSNLYNWISL